ncbi:MAG TPA: 6-bladed beta-propeller [Longimicrobium sp.]
MQTTGCRLAAFEIGVIAILFGGSACSSAVPASGQPPRAAVEDVIEWRRSVALEETADVINVSPHVNIDPRGGYIVADRREAQVRLYSASGSLDAQFGRRGQGPGEFERVVAAVRLASNEILAADMSGRVTFFDSAGANALRTQRLPLSPLYDLAVYDDSLVLLTGRIAGQEGSALVHVWNSRSGEVLRSFFQPRPSSPDLASAYTFTGFADVAVRRGTIVVSFAVSDTLRFYDIQGRELRQSAIPFRGFRPLRKAMPESGQREAIARWGEEFSSISQIQWSADGTLFVQYFDMDGYEPRWRLAALQEPANMLFELVDSPRLLAITADNSLVFADPSRDGLDTWLIGRLRS